MANRKMRNVKAKCKACNEFMYDLIFFNHLDKISFVNTFTMKEDKFKSNILNKASNHKVYDPEKPTYYV